MYILVAGTSGVGKSVMGDFIRNSIFKADNDCTIYSDDEDRQVKTFGRGQNKYTINVMRTLEKEDLEKADIVIEIKNKNFIDWFHKFNY